MAPGQMEHGRDPFQRRAYRDRIVDVAVNDLESRGQVQHPLHRRMDKQPDRPRRIAAAGAVAVDQHVHEAVAQPAGHPGDQHAAAFPGRRTPVRPGRPGSAERLAPPGSTSTCRLTSAGRAGRLRAGFPRRAGCGNPVPPSPGSNRTRKSCRRRHGRIPGLRAVRVRRHRQGLSGSWRRRPARPSAVGRYGGRCPEKCANHP